MKKELLISMMLLAGGITTAVAQNGLPVVSKYNKGNVEYGIQKIEVKEVNAQEVAYQNDKHLATRAGVTAIYDVPEGAYFHSLNSAGAGFSVPLMLTPVKDDVTFTNYSTKEARSTCKWTLELGNGEVQEITNVNAEGDATISPIFGVVNAPVVTATYEGSTASFTLGGNYQRPSQASFWMSGTDVVPMSQADPNAGMYMGFTDGPCFETNAVFYETGKKAIGFASHFEAPINHVYAESAYIFVIPSDPTNTIIIPEGKSLTAEFYVVTKDGIETTPFATATATTDNVSKLEGGENPIYHISFPLMQVDDLGFPVSAPIIIDKEFVIIIKGFEGINVKALFGTADGLQGNGYALLEDGTLSTVGYSNDAEMPMVNLQIGFMGAYPHVLAEEKTSTVTFPAEGGYGVSMTEQGQQYQDALVYTSVPLTNANGEENYKVVSKPEWISNIEYIDSEFENYGVISIVPSAAPLEGKGRYGEIVFDVLGEKVVIACKQGDTTGIEETVNEEQATSVEVINAAGQLVGTFEVKGEFTLPSELENGMYILKFNNNKVVKTIK